MVVHAHRLAAEVQRSTVSWCALMSSTRIRRDVHDGIGPTLAAVPIQLDVLTGRIDPNDDEALALAHRVKDQVLDAVADLRLLIDGLQPSSLEVLGLEGAIRHRIEGARDSGLVVEARLDELRDLEPAVAAATLHVVAEALTNTVRHAEARGAIQRGQGDGRRERQWVWADRPRAGVGLRSMEQRATNSKASSD